MTKDSGLQMNNSIKTLSNIVTYNKYAKYVSSKKRREV